jgi:hypothetical protein
MPQQSKLHEWLNFRDSFLDEMLYMYGHADSQNQNSCFNCEKEEEDGLYRCEDCFGRCLLHCASCIVKEHRFLPLHRVEVHRSVFLMFGFSDILYSIGTAISSRELPLKFLDCVYSLVMVGLTVHARYLDHRILLSLIQLAFIVSQSTIAIAVTVDRCTSETNFSELVGYQQHVIALRRFLRSSCSKHTMN